jgi:hypothetical protein
VLNHCQWIHPSMVLANLVFASRYVSSDRLEFADLGIIWQPRWNLLLVNSDAIHAEWYFLSHYLLYNSPVESFSSSFSRNGLSLRMSSLSCNSLPPALRRLSWFTFVIWFCWKDTCCTLGINLANKENGFNLLSWFRAKEIVITCSSKG